MVWRDTLSKIETFVWDFKFYCQRQPSVPCRQQTNEFINAKLIPFVDSIICS